MSANVAPIMSRRLREQQVLCCSSGTPGNPIWQMPQAATPVLSRPPSLQHLDRPLAAAQTLHQEPLLLRLESLTLVVAPAYLEAPVCESGARDTSRFLCFKVPPDFESALRLPPSRPILSNHNCLPGSALHLASQPTAAKTVTST